MVWLKLYLAIALGGAFGACARYSVTLAVSRMLPGTFAWGTFTANVVGSLIIGIMYAMIHDKHIISESMRPLLITGLLGGFTTFSAFSLETAGHLLEGQFGYALIYTLSSVFVCVAASLAGVLLTRALM